MPLTAEQDRRRSWISLLAQSDAPTLAALWAESGLAADFHWLRAPETGGVMVQGRMGASGAAFNLGEMTVTRASLQLDDGTVGHAYVQGRDKTKAQIAAQVDALMQTGQAERAEAAILAPLRAAGVARRSARAARAAATKVDFFTMARGDV
ncbi:MAG: phosphonate C-P lyase system protein PhnG [Rhodobacteraceae bacterium]|nr:phosphonate C-P lyase system protein PhnG [Paracoccaceae bacterium]